MLVERHTELGIGQFLTVIFQRVLQSWPCAPPLTQSLLNISQFLGLLVVRDITITLQSQFTTLWQVCVYLNHRVEIFFWSKLINLDSRHTSRPTITYLVIIVVHGAETPAVVQFIADNVQQVMIEDIGIHALDDKGCVGIVLHLGKSFTEVWRQHRLLDDHLQTTVLSVDTMENCLVHGFQHHIGSGLISLLKTHHGRFQRVWSHVSHHVDTS